MPRGNMLRDSEWVDRQRWINCFALIQALGLGLVALAAGRGPIDVLLAVAVSGLPGVVGADRRLSRRVRTLSTVTSLMFASATLVDLTGGLIEAHFHFFVMLGVVSLYQDWAAFGLCALITVTHHAVMGLTVPTSVFAGTREQQHPVQWALIHAGFIAAASVTHMIAWRANELQELRDSMTRLANRACFTDDLARRAATFSRPVSVLFIDIDDFKTINDTGGHHLGDAALCRTAAAMRAATRPGDLVARLGGDEFAIVLSAPASTASAVAERLAHALQAPLCIDDREIKVSASIGLVDDATLGNRDPDNLLRAADEAMYVAKSSGRGRIVCFSAAMDRTAARRSRLRRDLAEVTVTSQMHLLFQPIVEGATGRLHSVEALLRWRHPAFGLVAPTEFIPLAEENGSIDHLGTWMMTEACLHVAAWRRTVPQLSHVRLSINLSAHQLHDPALPDLIDTALATSGLPASCLSVEVTETAMLADLDAARVQLNWIRARGVTVSIDDFGTGYSSLSYLARLPVDQLKIDRSFVAELLSEASALALVRCILDVARALNLTVVAEGVEEATQQRLLTQLGCRWLQGYLFAAPMLPHELIARHGQPAGTADVEQAAG